MELALTANLLYWNPIPMPECNYYKLADKQIPRVIQGRGEDVDRWQWVLMKFISITDLSHIPGFDLVLKEFRVNW